MRSNSGLVAVDFIWVTDRIGIALIVKQSGTGPVEVDLIGK